MTSQDTNYTYNFSGNTLDFKQSVVMGILNITPDSFFDGGRYTDEKSINKQVDKMLFEGASIIDIGAYSSRPGAVHINEKDELIRLLPVLKDIRKKHNSRIISVDTFRANVAEQAIDAGADLINDISGGTMDKNMFNTISRLKVPYILTHIQGTPQTMQQNPKYNNIVEDVKLFFEQKIRHLNSLGVKNIIIDPGFGLGKTIEHNFSLLKNMQQFNSFGYPMLAGISRKSMITKVLDTKAVDSLNGTTVLNTIALLNGANILRVHDVKEAMQTIRLVREYLK